ncbi:FAD-binding protein [Streptomyces sp. NBC_00285]
MAEVLRTGAAHGLTLTFRSGGPSLSGQATNDEVFVDTRCTFRSIEILDDGARVRVRGAASTRRLPRRDVRRPAHRPAAPRRLLERALLRSGPTNTRSTMRCSRCSPTLRSVVVRCC